jgi:hypothetical protein
MNRRLHRIKNSNKKSTSKLGSIAWKSSKYRTETSRLALVVIFFLVVDLYFGGEVANLNADHRPSKGVRWWQIRNLLMRAVPEIDKPGHMFTQQGDEVIFSSLSDKSQRDRISGRWDNFFHEYYPKKGVKRWSLTDTEHPYNNALLLPLVEEAKKRVRRILNES